MAKDFVQEVAKVEILAQIVKEDDGFHVIDSDGTKGDVCKLCDEGKTIVLTKNASNRKWYNLAKAEAEIAENGYVGLTYKASKTFGPAGSRLPNSKLISYLSEEDQAEYKAIIDRAIEAKKADKVVKPKMTEQEKLLAKIQKLQAQLADLDA